MPVPSGLSEEDAAKFRTAETVENVVEANLIVGQAKKRIFEYREGLQNEIEKATARLEYMHRQRDELDQWLCGDALKMWKKENEPTEGDSMDVTTDLRRDSH